MSKLRQTRAQAAGNESLMNTQPDNPGQGGAHRKHTPIVSEKQRGLFGAELSRRRRGLTPRMPGITTAELERHLEESAGKKLPKRTKRR